jgi:hypothetical protein
MGDNLSQQAVSAKYRNKAVIYQWYNLITGRTYVGSGQNAASRPGNYWTLSQLLRPRPLEQDITLYGHANFALAILAVVGPVFIFSIEKIKKGSSFSKRSSKHRRLLP